MQLNNKRRTSVVLCAAAVGIMAAALIDGHGMRQFQPIPIAAKESFREIGRIVEEHDEDNPYRILDIVPSTVYCDVAMKDMEGHIAETERYEFSTGTIGYLSNGYTALTRDFVTAFTNPAFRFRADREELFHNVITKDAVDHFPGIQYEEAYGGVHDILPATEGWSILSDSQVIEEPKSVDESVIKDMTEGVFKGTFAEISSGEDTEGYDYAALTDSGMGGADTGFLEYNEDGAWHVAFSAADDLLEETNLYEVESVHTYGIGDYSLATGLYCLDENGQYHYAGTVAQIIYGTNDDEIDDEIDTDTGEEDYNPEQEEGLGDKDDGEDGLDEEDHPDKEDESDEKDELNGGEGSDEGDDAKEDTPDKENNTENSPEDVREGKLDEKDGIEETGQWNQLVEIMDQDYYVVVFRHVEDISDIDGMLYQVSERNLIDGEVRPFDSYDMAGSDDSLRFVYVGEGRGNYRLFPSPDDTGDMIEIFNAPVYVRCYSANDWLKEYVFDSLPGGHYEESSFTIQIENVRADQVTVDMIREADLVYLESGRHMFLCSEDTETEESDYSLAVDYIQKSYADMGSSPVGEILRRAVDDWMPVIVDYDIVADGNYQDTNYQYLAKALLKRDLDIFYEEMNKKGNLLDNLKMNIDLTEEFPDKTDNEYNYVNKNVYIAGGDTPFIWEDFYEPFDQDETMRGFLEVTAAMEAENMTRPEDEQIEVWVSKARAIQYIIHFSGGITGALNDLSILEIQPTANLSSDLYRVMNEEGDTRLYWQTQSMEAGKQILHSSEPFETDIRVKSVVQFNGEREDINSAYDMIFIGLDGQRLNLEGDLFKSPVYNKEELNGKVYHRGDDSGAGVYDANDITPQKMADLLEYMEAGYPVLVESNCFKRGTAKNASKDEINTKYIDEETVMYQFLSSAVSDGRYRECIYTIADAQTDPMLMTRLKSVKPRVHLMDEDKEAAAGVRHLQSDENGKYHGKIAYTVKSDSGEEYPGDVTVHLYADMDYDGLFRLEEELNGYTDEGNVIDLVIDNMGTGILPWKLEIMDVDNPLKRDGIQGYFAWDSSYVEEVKVLQVTEKIDDGSVSLQDIYERKEDSLLSYYLHDAEKTAGVSLRFETVTAAELAHRLEGNENYLRQWDIVVLTMDQAVAIDSVAAAVGTYVEEGRSLLVCSQNAEGNRMGLPAELLGQKKEERTYVSLGASGASGRYRYDGLEPDFFVPKADLQFEQINEGCIAYDPYPMEGKSLHFGTKGKLRAADYLLDCGGFKIDENAADVTVWYTFGGDIHSAYGISPGDACNNYYCYSRENVVWLGQSEYPYTYDTQEGTVPEGVEGSDECKFFVNALMAAYRAGIHNTKVSIVAGFAPDSVQVKSILIPFDQEWQDASDDTAGILDHTVEVYFKFTDNNIAMDKNTELQFYYEDPSGQELDLCGETVYAALFASELCTVIDNQLVSVEGNNLEAGRIYRIKAPAVALGNNGNIGDANIYVVAATDFKRSGKEYHVTGACLVSLSRAQLFPLE